MVDSTKGRLEQLSNDLEGIIKGVVTLWLENKRIKDHIRREESKTVVPFNKGDEDTAYSLFLCEVLDLPHAPTRLSIGSALHQSWGFTPENYIDVIWILAERIEELRRERNLLHAQFEGS